MTAVRLLLADDHPVVRAGLRAVLEAEGDLVVVDEAATAEAAVARAARGGLDVVLMDLQFGTAMGGAAMGGAAATRLIVGRPGAPRVLVLTTFDTESDIVEAIEAGAAGYLLKDAPPDELAAAVRAAAAGGSALAPAIARRLMERMRVPTRALTAREVEVLMLVAEGLSNQAISRALFLSQATVKTHLVHIFDKLDVESRTAAVAAATARGLIRRGDG